MSLDALSSLSALLLAISLATERLITILKTVFGYLRDEKRNERLETDFAADRGRRLSVQGIAFAAAWATSSFLADGGFSPFGWVPVSLQAGSDPARFPVIVLALLASGGSAFWGSVLGYTRAVREANHRHGEVVGAEASRRARLERGVDRANTALAHASALGPPGFDLEKSRL